LAIFCWRYLLFRAKIANDEESLKFCWRYLLFRAKIANDEESLKYKYRQYYYLLHTTFLLIYFSPQQHSLKHAET